MPQADDAMMWIDCEVHVLPPEWCREDYRPPESEDVLNRVFYDHPDRALALPGLSEDGLLAEMNAANVAKSVIMGLPWRDAERNWANTAYTAELVERHPDRFWGMAVVPSPYDEDPRDIARKVHDEYGLTGCKTIPSWQGICLNDPRYEPMFTEMERLGLMLETHTDHPYLDPAATDPPHALFEVARRHPGLKIVAPHLGGMVCLYALLEKAAAVLKNILFVTSVPLTMPMVRYAVDAVGADNVAFGTDFPMNPSHDQATVRRDLEALGLADDDIRKVAGLSALRFLEGETGT